MKSRASLVAALLPTILLAACGGADDGSGKGDADPAVQAALNDPIMVDPDLAGQNEGNAALTGGTDHSLPPELVTPAAIQSAKEEAMALVGGSVGLKAVPKAVVLAANTPEPAAHTAAARAAVSPGGENCAQAVEYSTAWAARLPTAFPVYPRGSTQEAAGTDKGECSLRVVNFLTPVALDDVLSFYFTRASANGYSAQHLKKDGDDIVSGIKGRASFVIYARRQANGLTDVDLVTSGK